MREILFKGKDEKGVWHEGDLIQYGIYTSIRFGVINENNFTDYFQEIVFPETVCQFTGLRDKNGNKIFEGDELMFTDFDSISEDEYQNKGVLSYCLDSVGFTLSNREGVDMDSIDFSDCEIIGNINDKTKL